MTAVHGSQAVLHIADSGGTLRDYTNIVDTTGLPRSVDSVDVTTLGATQKSYIPGLKDGTIPLSGPWDPIYDGYLDGILRKANVAFEYFPAGNTGGGGTNVKYTGTGMLTKYDITSPVADKLGFDAELQQSGNTARSLV